MHIFRWLMTHPIITAWILAALAILLNLNMGTKGDHDNNEGGRQVTHEVVESGQSLANHEPGTSGSDVIAASKEAKGEVGVEGHKPVKFDTDQEVTLKKAAGPLVESAGEQITDSLAKIDELASMKSEDLIQLAREAFWQNDKEKSVAIYQVLIEREPDSLTHKGELANVYWHQQRQKESAALYAEIAVPMVKAGKSKEVSNMLGFIGVFFPEKAAELQHLISK